MTALASALAPVPQHYLLEARQMQALSFAVHIPLVAFGNLLPCDGAVRRVALAAQRRSSVSHSRAAVDARDGGAVRGRCDHGHDPELRDGSPVAQLHCDLSAASSASASRSKGFSFFLEAIFIGIYVYGWGRCRRRRHFVSGLPIVVTGFTGSLTVISVNAWMNHPGGFQLRGGKVVDIHPLKALFANSYLWHELVHMYIAGYIVSGFLVAGAYAFARLRGRWAATSARRSAIPLTIAALASPGAGPRRRLGGARRCDHTANEARRVRGLGNTRRGAPEHLLGWYSDGRVKYGIAIPHALVIPRFP